MFRLLPHGMRRIVESESVTVSDFAPYSQGWWAVVEWWTEQGTQADRGEPATLLKRDLYYALATGARKVRLERNGYRPVGEVSAEEYRNPKRPRPIHPDKLVDDLNWWMDPSGLVIPARHESHHVIAMLMGFTEERMEKTYIRCSEGALRTARRHLDPRQEDALEKMGLSADRVDHL